MKVIIKEPGKKPELRDIENTLETLQKLVGGYIETHTRKDYVLICNEEGRIRHMEPNFFGIEAGSVFYGPAVFVGYEGDEFTDLSDKAVRKLNLMLDPW